jgi:thioesterase domain-containing protein
LVSLACSKMTDIFGTPIGIRDFFGSPTPASLGEVIQVLIKDSKDENGSKGAAAKGAEDILPTHFVFNNVPNKPLLFCLPTHTGLGNVYSHLAMASQNFTVVALNDPFLRGVGLTGERDPSSFTLQELAEIFYETVKGLDRDMEDAGGASEGEVPLNVLGYSFGGNVAIEVARLARDEGRKVNLFLVDCADSAVSLDIDNAGMMEFNMSDMPQEMYQESLQNSVKLSYEMVIKDSGAASHGLLTKDNMPTVRSCMEANHNRLFRHKTAYYPGSAVMFRSDGNALHGLHRKFDSLEEITLEGNHSSLLQHSMGQLELLVDRISVRIS